MVREHAQAVRGELVAELEGAAKDLSALLETARESDGDRLRCKNCGSFIPGISKLKLSDILAVIWRLRLPLIAQIIAQKHGGALLAGGKPEHPGTSHHMVREHVPKEVRGQMIGVGGGLYIQGALLCW